MAFFYYEFSQYSTYNLQTLKVTYPFADWTAFICLIWTLFLGKLTACLQSSIVNGLKYLPVEHLCLFTVKWKPHGDKCISQALYANANWTVTEVGNLCLRKRFYFQTNFK